MNNCLRIAALAGLVAMLTACSVTQQGDAVVIDKSAADTDITAEPQPTRSHTASTRLLADADNQIQQQRLPQAVALLERAVRIDPDNAWIWLRLAQVRMQQQEYQLTESLALKAIQLAGGNRSVRYQGWTLIAESRAKRGLDAAARQAEQRAGQYRP